jgi:integrase
LGDADIVAFLTHLAAERRVSRSTQMQALSALMLLYREVLCIEIGDLRDKLRSFAPTRLPAVLSRAEVRLLLEHLHGTTQLIALLLYGSGLRLMECLTLRVKDIDFDQGEIRVRRGKGAKDRVTMLPIAARGGLIMQLERVRPHWSEKRRTGQGSLRGNGYSRRHGDIETPRRGTNAAIISTRRPCSAQCRRQFAPPELPSAPPATRCDIPSRLICSRMATIFERSRSYSATRM